MLPYKTTLAHVRGRVNINGFRQGRQQPLTESNQGDSQQAPFDTDLPLILGEEIVMVTLVYFVKGIISMMNAKLLNCLLNISKTYKTRSMFSLF